MNLYISTIRKSAFLFGRKFMEEKYIIEKLKDYDQRIKEIEKIYKNINQLTIEIKEIVQEIRFIRENQNELKNNQNKFDNRLNAIENKQIKRYDSIITDIIKITIGAILTLVFVKIGLM